MKSYPLLEQINNLDDLRKLEENNLTELADELRSYMVDCVSNTGGHLASSLGAVEIIIALHRVFHVPQDKIIFDVGHQAYAHKILTGRREAFKNLRQKNGISGFPKREESEYDAFNTGHASTSVSAALGYARAMKLKNEPGRAIAVIGDGAMTGGLALEAMNDAGQANVPLIVILNDNNMSIAENVGAIHTQLTNIRLNKKYRGLKMKLVRLMDKGEVGNWLSKHMGNLKNRVKNALLPNLLFEEMGFTYYGPIDGHDIKEMELVFNNAKSISGAVLIHVVTQKGYGYKFAEENPEKFHGVSEFNPKTGEIKKGKKKTNSDVFGDTILELAKENPNIVAITAAMPAGTGLSKFKNTFPNRIFDVGICEEHAVTMAAGMAAGGLSPVVAMYSSFLQRAYDEILHDVCVQNLPVTFAVDRAGLVGQDGPTHQGIYDIAFLTSMPNMRIYSPASQHELKAMLEMAIERKEPAAIRYNRGCLMQAILRTPLEFGKWEIIDDIKPVTIVATGCMVKHAMPIANKFGVGLVNARFIEPMDLDMIQKIRTKCKYVITIEEAVTTFGNMLKLKIMDTVSVNCLGITKEVLGHASVEEQQSEAGISDADIEKAVRDACNATN